MGRYIQREEERERREEERRLKAEEKENEKILRMDKKVSGVMLDTTISQPEEIKVRDDIHEITLNEEPCEEDSIPVRQIRGGTHKIATPVATADSTDHIRIRGMVREEMAEINTPQPDMESIEAAIHRELEEEMGVSVDILAKIGIVSDYYNCIHRHNINHYFLCKIKKFGNNHLTEDERNKFHLLRVCLKYKDAVKEYEDGRKTKIGRLVYNREMPILKRAYEIILEGDF